MLPQLKVLLLLFGIFITIFLIARHFLIPDSFGQYGHYRGNSLKENADNEVVYSTKNQCIECHQDINEMLISDVHAEISCISCHGPGLEHVKAPEKQKIEKPGGRVNCGLCHAFNPARPKSAINQIDIVEHHKEIDNCVECHNPHQVWEKLQ